MDNFFHIAGIVATALPALLIALIAFFSFIPGPEPERTLQVVLDFLQKAKDFISQFSKK